jgi:hypothetical protein
MNSAELFRRRRRAKTGIKPEPTGKVLKRDSAYYYGMVSKFHSPAMQSTEHIWKRQFVGDVQAAMEALDPEPLRKYAQAIARWRTVNRAIVQGKGPPGEPLLRGFKAANPKNDALLSTYHKGIRREEHWRKYAKRIGVDESDRNNAHRDFVRRGNDHELAYVKRKN